MFWVDLSQVNLIEASFNTAVSAPSGNAPALTATNLSLYFPAAKVGYGNYVYAYSNSFGTSGGWAQGTNLFGISEITSGPLYGRPISSTSMPVKVAYDIDKKVDDGLPQTGRITAQYDNAGTDPSAALYWAAGAGTSGAADTAATQGSQLTCYDNGNVTGQQQQYSVEISNGSNVNCALSFQMQAGD